MNIADISNDIIDVYSILYLYINIIIFLFFIYIKLKYIIII